mgnify:CR=1 FL=1
MARYHGQSGRSLGADPEYRLHPSLLLIRLHEGIKLLVELADLLHCGVIDIKKDPHAQCRFRTEHIFSSRHLLRAQASSGNHHSPVLANAFEADQGLRGLSPELQSYRLDGSHPRLINTFGADWPQFVVV